MVFTTMKKVATRNRLKRNFSDYQEEPTQERPYKVVIVGKPNVGKSSLFNRIVGNQVSIVHPEAGVTRDRVQEEVKQYDHPFLIEDTPGIVFGENSALSDGMMKVVQEAIEEADLVFFIVDGMYGITKDDHDIANWLSSNFQFELGSQSGDFDDKFAPRVFSRLEEKTFNTKPIPITGGLPADTNRKRRLQLVVGKSDTGDNWELTNDIYALGLGDPLFVSALQGDGMHEIFREIKYMFSPSVIEAYKERRKLRRVRYEKLKKELAEDISAELRKLNREFDLNSWLNDFDLANGNPEENSDLDEDSEVDPKKYFNTNVAIESVGVTSDNFMSKRRIKICIVGKPNTGKSTLVNSLLGRDRVLVHDQPHTTTDPIGVNFVRENTKFRLIDTAGLEGHTHLKSDLDKMIYQKTIRSIQQSDVAIVLIDALDSFRNLDFTLINMAIDEGRAVVVVINKWDLIDPKWKEKAAKYMIQQVDDHIATLDAKSIQLVSAKEGIRVKNILGVVQQTYNHWNARISTGLLNIWLKKFKKVQKLPTERLKKLKILYVVQIKTRPPTFSVFVNDLEMADDNYVKFMKRHLAEEFKLLGSPIRLIFRGTKYKHLKKKLEKMVYGNRGEIRRTLLKKRKIKTFAKIKLDELNEKRQRYKRGYQKGEENN